VFNSDIPISEKENDLLNRSSFVSNIANAILGYQKSDSLVIGLYGEWGSGKSSIANLMISELEKQEYEDSNQKPIIIKFNPWNFSDQNQLLSQLFQTIASALNYISIPEALDKKSKVMKKIGQISETASHIPEPIISSIAKIAAPLFKSYADALSPNGNTGNNLQEMKNSISQELKKAECKIIIFIDDIDRLNKTEIRQIFQAVKSLGDFPNTVYILMFDKNIVAQSLDDIQAGDGEDYLKKIVQIPIAIPVPDANKINSVFEEKTKQIIGSNKDRIDIVYWQNIIDLCIKPFVKNIRDVNRLLNSFEFKYYLIGSEVNLADLMAISSFEIFMPEVHQWIRSNRDILLGEKLDRIFSRNKEIFNKSYYVEQVKPLCGKYDPEIIIKALSVVFPVINHDVNGMTSENDRWNYLMRDKRIASSKKFEYYFKLSLEEDEISHSILDNILRNESFDVVKEAFSGQNRLAHVLFEELRVSTEAVPQERISLLLEAILCSYPSLCSLEYHGFFNIRGETYALWITQALLARIDEEQRLEFFSKDISQYPKKSIFLYLELLLYDERHYGRWLPAGSNYSYKPIFEEKQINVVEEKVLEMILEQESEDFIFDLDRSYFNLLISIWEKLDNYNPQIDKRIKSYMTTEKNILYLISQKTLRISPEVVHSGNQDTWRIDVDGICRYMSLEYAYSCVVKTKNTHLITEMPEYMRDGLVAFALYFEEATEKRTNVVRDDLVQQKLPEWCIHEQHTNSNTGLVI